MEDKGQVLELDFPITVATAPYRVTNAPFPILQYGMLLKYRYCWQEAKSHRK
jgi:hypothetical protein